MDSVCLSPMTWAALNSYLDLQKCKEDETKTATEWVMNMQEADGDKKQRDSVAFSPLSDPSITLWLVLHSFPKWFI